MKRFAPAAVSVALVAAPLFLVPVTASADSSGMTVVLQSGINGCEGVLTTPGSANTNKRLDPDFPSDFNPGGQVGYIIDYPVDISDVSGRTTFVITDCIFVDGNAVAKYLVSFVPNTTSFELQFSVPIPMSTPMGSQFCNYAKTTAAPSHSQASNRKAGPACFTVGGGIRIEKRSGSVTGPLLPGASFSVVCSPTVGVPPTIITGLDPSVSNPDGTVSASGVAGDGTIAINGPSGTHCTATETQAPPNYQGDPTPRDLVIPVGNTDDSQTVSVFVNRQFGSLQITKAADVPGTFLFDINCSNDSFDRSGVPASPGHPYTLDGIPTGTSCTVTERNNPLFSSVVDPSTGTVVIGTGINTVAFTNTRLRGSLVITKAADAPGTFLFDVDCSDNSFDRTAVAASPGHPYTLAGIPTGTTCTVTEENNPLFSSVSVPADGTVVIGTGDNTVAFTNTRLRGTLVITKAADAPGTFLFDIDCSDNAFDRTGVPASPGNPYRLAGIPTGTTCTVTEESNPLFSSVVVPTDGTVVIATGDNTVAFTNTRLNGGLVITKAADAPGTFLFDIDCSDNAFDRTAVPASPGHPYSLAGIPTGTTCRVTEESNSLFSSVSVPSDGTVEIGTGDSTVAFTNTRLRGTLVVTKAADQPGTFLFDIDCSDDNYDRSGVAASPGHPYNLEGIPTGTSCTVTERNNPLFTSVAVPADGTVEIAGGLNTVAFTNTAKPNGISIDKTVNGEDTSAQAPLDVEVGSTLHYQVVITNSGQVPLSVSDLSDSLNANLADSCDPSLDTMLDPGDSITCSYTTTAADPGGASIIHNMASVEGLDVFERTAGPAEDETFVHVLDPAIHLDKSGPAAAHVGDTITYTLTVTNPGNTPLAITDFADDVCDAAPSLESKQGEDDLLDPGETWVYECSHVVLNGDPDSLVNTATVTGADRLETDVESTDDATTAILRPAIAITKTGASSAHVGDPVVYTLVVTNPGNTPLADVTVSDPKCDGLPVRDGTDADGLLSHGEAWTYHCTHVIIDGDGEQIVNTATVQGIDALEKTVDASADHPTDILRPAIAVTKTGASNVHVGDAVVYTLVVTNPGNTPLSGVTVTDPKCDGLPVRDGTDGDGLLSPGETWTYHCTHVATAADGASILNTAKAVGTDTLGETVDDTANHTAVVLHPAITIVKTADPVSISVSGTVTYTYVVTNTGDAALHDVEVSDDILGLIGIVSSLAPGETVTLAKTVDVDANTPPTNIGTAVGTDVLGETVTASDDATITVVLGEVLTKPAELPRTGAPLQTETRAALAMIEVGLILELSARYRRRTRRRAD